jgi:hypothetical protein
VRVLLCSLILAAAPAALVAQASQAAPASRPAPLPDAQQIAAAVLPLPEEFREGAIVLGYRAGTPGLVRLREGSGPFICLANDPAEERFHVACYHQSLEPFMARGRELRAQGVRGAQVDTVRFAEVDSGKLPMPKQPAALFSLSGPAGAFDAASGAVTGARPLFVVYIPGATAQSTGLSAKPAQNTPWIMYPGTPKAHIMFVPSM